MTDRTEKVSSVYIMWEFKKREKPSPQSKDNRAALFLGPINPKEYTEP